MVSISSINPSAIKTATGIGAALAAMGVQKNEDNIFGGLSSQLEQQHSIFQNQTFETQFTDSLSARDNSTVIDTQWGENIEKMHDRFINEGMENIKGLGFNNDTIAAVEKAKSEVQGRVKNMMKNVVQQIAQDTTGIRLNPAEAFTNQVLSQFAAQNGGNVVESYDVYKIPGIDDIGKNSIVSEVTGGLNQGNFEMPDFSAYVGEAVNEALQAASQAAHNRSYSQSINLNGNDIKDKMEEIANGAEFANILHGFEQVYLTQSSDVSIAGPRSTPSVGILTRASVSLH